MAKATTSKLSDRQRRFCEEYIVDLNGTQAGIRAGYSPKTAGSQAEQLLKKPEIKSYVQELMNKRSNKTEITAEMVLRELAVIGFSNIQDYIKTGFTINDIASLDKKHASAIESIKIKTFHGEKPSTEVSFKLHDKLSALETIAKHIGFFDADNRQKNAPIKQFFKFGDNIIEF